ncbi:MAG: MarR family transcriptional regulator [Bacteroidales bacterium]|nr:MarR family transcriptional regulator [Bacteroidales bacterium]
MKIEDEIKGRFRNEFHKAIINLTYTTNQLSHGFLQVVKKHGLSIQQYNILRVLRGFKSQPSSIGFLKERMLDQSSDVSRLVDRLVLRNLVQRTESATDRRLKDVVITQDGLDLLAKMDHCESQQDELLKTITEDEARQLNTLLDKIRG